MTRELRGARVDDQRIHLAATMGQPVVQANAVQLEANGLSIDVRPDQRFPQAPARDDAIQLVTISDFIAALDRHDLDRMFLATEQDDELPVNRLFVAGQLASEACGPVHQRAVHGRRHGDRQSGFFVDDIARMKTVRVFLIDEIRRQPALAKARVGEYRIEKSNVVGYAANVVLVESIVHVVDGLLATVAEADQLGDHRIVVH